MRCDHVRRILERKAARSLTPRDEQMLAGHMSGCGECAAFEDQLDRTWRALEYHPSVAVSSDFLPRLRARLNAAEPESRSGWMRRPARAWRWVAVAAAITLAVLILTRGGQFRRDALPANPDASTATDRDRRDDQFLVDLERTLQYSAADTLSAFDSWSFAPLELTAPEPAKTGPARTMKKKEPS